MILKQINMFKKCIISYSFLEDVRDITDQADGISLLIIK